MSHGDSNLQENHVQTSQKTQECWKWSSQQEKESRGTFRAGVKAVWLIRKTTWMTTIDASSVSRHLVPPPGRKHAAKLEEFPGICMCKIQTWRHKGDFYLTFECWQCRVLTRHTLFFSEPPINTSGRWHISHLLPTCISLKYHIWSWHEV